MSSKETQNPFSDSFGIKNPILDFLKETHPNKENATYHVLYFVDLQDKISLK